ncbi:hypothetical protein [Methylomonas fluvii]|nr:hypothetical protein [Methylomonas fluvii]
MPTMTGVDRHLSDGLGHCHVDFGQGVLTAKAGKSHQLGVFDNLPLSYS